ncbi:MAG: PD-(D/E)XK nuclease family protein [Ilumatobacteraceae bacterium]
MSDTEANLTPVQRTVLEALAKEPGFVPLPIAVIESVRTQLHELVADIAEQIEPDKSLWVSKNKVTTVHGCEGHYLANLGNFEWTVANVRGTVVHKAIELATNWRGDFTPSDVVDQALDRVAADERISAADFVDSLSDTDRAELRSGAIDLYTKFEECFPPLKAAWRPVLESSARYEMFDKRIIMSTKTDLTLGASGNKVIIDVKTGSLHPHHREELRFYALIEALRTGLAPRKLATLSLLTARIDVEDVSEGVLQAAIRKTADAIRKMYELEREKREPRLVPSATCRWCPLAETCSTGQEFLAQGDEADYF